MWKFGLGNVTGIGASVAFLWYVVPVIEKVFG